ncbi:MAG: TyeA family type III secretion system gatekeeper subunit [Endozoicomonas sp.]
MSQVGGVQTSQQPGLETRQAGEAGKQAASGKVNGETFVAQTNTASQVADIAEEMSMLSHQFKDKTFDKRKAKSGSELSERLLKQVEKIQTLQNVQALKDLLNQFGTQANLSDGEIKKKLKDFSDDVLEQFVALDLAAEYFEELGDTKKAEKLRGIRDELKKNNETLIKAGLNVSGAAAEFVAETGEGSVRELREEYARGLDSYFDHVSDHKTLEQAYQNLLKNNPQASENFEKAVKLQLRLLATDLGSLDPSSPPERLQAIIQDLSKLKTLVGVHDGCLETEQQIARMFPDVALAERVLMSQLLQLVEQQWVTEADFERLPGQINVTELEAQIFALTKVVAIIRMIPEEVFANDETRQNMVAAASEGLDGFIEREAEAEVENASAATDQAYGIIGEVTAPLNLPEVTGSGITDLMPGILQEKPADPPPSASPKIIVADTIVRKFSGQLPGEQYAGPMDVFKDVQALAGRPQELEKLLGYLPELREAGPEAEQLADMAEKYIGDLLASTKPGSGLVGDLRQEIKVQNN